MDPRREVLGDSRAGKGTWGQVRRGGDRASSADGRRSTRAMEGTNGTDILVSRSKNCVLRGTGRKIPSCTPMYSLALFGRNFANVSIPRVLP